MQAPSFKGNISVCSSVLIRLPVALAAVFVLFVTTRRFYISFKSLPALKSGSVQGHVRLKDMNKRHVLCVNTTKLYRKYYGVASRLEKDSNGCTRGRICTAVPVIDFVSRGYDFTRGAVRTVN